MDSSKIPIVDMSSCYYGDSQEDVDQLIHAFRNFGCAYVTKHGIPRNQVGCDALNESAQRIPTIVYLYVNLLGLLTHVGVSNLTPVHL